MKINLNNPVHVKLTPAGRETLTRYRRKTIQDMGDSLNVKHAVQVYNHLAPGSNNIFYCQLWELFQIFGATIGDACDIPFDQNEIEFE